jgi:putative SOS response-associated peptidase YedK
MDELARLKKEMTMCGRFFLTSPEQIAAQFPALAQASFPLHETYNAAPSQALPVIIETGPDRWEPRLMHWGLLPRWKNSGKTIPPPINARAETLPEKSMFKRLLAERRCLVPASGFFEWQAVDKRKQPYAIRPTDQALFVFAGLWDETTPDDADADVSGSFTIVTTAANSKIARLHQRMPVILETGEDATWLSIDLKEPDAVMPLLDAYPADRMEAYPVSPAVNSVRNNDPSLIERITLDRKSTQETLFS